MAFRDCVTFESINLKLPTTVYAEGNDVTISSDCSVENTTTTIYGGSGSVDVAETNLQLYAGTYTAIYGGGKGKNVMGDTNVTIGGSVNSTIDHTNHDENYCLYGGGENGTVLGNTNVTVGETAKFRYIFGGGRGSSSTIVGEAYVAFAGKTMSIYGGSYHGTNSHTHVIMTGGYAEQIFGGSYLKSMTGNTDVRILGGEVERRVYGGCYNDTTSTNYHVDGYVSVTVDKRATLPSTISLLDYGVYAITRHLSKSFDTEKSVFIFNDYENNATNLSKISKESLYLVKVTAGGTVTMEDGALCVRPNEGYKASVDNAIDMGDGIYELPKSKVTISVEFTPVN